MDTDLTHKQTLFCAYYLGEARGNATLAAKLAGYEGTESTLQTIGYENLRKPAIAETITGYLHDVHASRERITMELAAIAFTPWETFVTTTTDHRGTVVDAKINLADKVRALELLGKMHRMFVERVEMKRETNVKVNLAWDDAPVRIPAWTGEIPES